MRGTSATNISVALAEALQDLGLSAARAQVLVSSYTEPPESFQPRKEGLDAAQIGLN